MDYDLLIIGEEQNGIERAVAAAQVGPSGRCHCRMRPRRFSRWINCVSPHSILPNMAK